MKRFVLFVFVIVLTACGVPVVSNSQGSTTVPATQLPVGDIKIDIRVQDYKPDINLEQKMEVTIFVTPSQPAGNITFMGEEFVAGTKGELLTSIMAINDSPNVSLSDGINCRLDHVEKGSNDNFARLHFLCP